MVRSKLTLTVVVAVLMVTSITYSLSLVSTQKPPPPTQPAPAPKSAVIPPVVYRGLPTRLKIPAINVDAGIEYVGDTPQGFMAVPEDTNKVGWYKHGALPGDPGGSVLAGHVVGPKGQPAIFINLDKLEKGDVMEVIDASGQTASFTVRDKKTYDRNDQPSEVFKGTGETHLNLITCSGKWDAAQRQYQKRLVIFAVRSA